ncbi:hypothetical protein P0E69_02910 [Chimaeribacter arupi]|uniref:hypothetical protein n=1 Tax=Chimaeribacter arupi TaxID=2060066 RepID=UPI002711DC9B|nr:hypothetical protein [Chimaeribacter arupi]WKZ92918.1 hypothetical protein P0E69_02910 [Chimaeribacter arupi]
MLMNACLKCTAGVNDNEQFINQREPGISLLAVTLNAEMMASMARGIITPGNLTLCAAILLPLYFSQIKKPP